MTERNLTQADHEALTWLLALQETPDDADLVARFEAWREADPVNADMWDQAVRVYALIGDMPPVHVERWERLLGGNGPMVAGARRHRPVRSVRPSASRGRIMAALTAAAAAIILTVFAPGVMVDLRSDHATGVGEVRRIRLDDGSLVSLAPQSALAVDYSADRREVRLLRGRAWFDVRHDSGRPFEVATRNIDLIVLGTAFEVDTAGVGPIVSVQRGLVKVASPDGRDPQRVPAGHSVMLTPEGRLSQAVVDPNNVAAWREGQTIVEDVAIRDVVRSLRPWSRNLILIQSKAIAERRVTGVYNLRDPEAVTRALAQAYDLKITHLTPWVLLISKN